MLLVLKVLLVPGLIAVVSLAGRRWGPRVAGVLTGLPLVAGPVLLFLALEQGPAFGARAALSTLAALVGVAGFCVVYAWASLYLPWPPGLLAGWATFALAAVAVHAVSWRPSMALAAAVVSFAAGRAVLPSRRGRTVAARRPPWDLWLRMGSAATLVLVTTSLAPRLGPALSGVLTPFPVAVSVLAAFAHAQQGVPAVLSLLGSLLPSMWSFAAFCYVLTVGLEPLGVAPASSRSGSRRPSPWRCSCRSRSRVCCWPGSCPLGCRSCPAARTPRPQTAGLTGSAGIRSRRAPSRRGAPRDRRPGPRQWSLPGTRRDRRG